MRYRKTARPSALRAVLPRAADRLFAAGLLALLTACGGGERREPDGAAGDTATATQTPASTPAPGPSAGAAAPAGGNPADPRLIALGDSVFHGQVGGGTCQTCHGQGGKGGQIGPSLADTQWLNGDGSYQFIVNTVTNGVPNPKQYPAAMPPMGGAQLSPEQVRAVSAYVYSVSRGGS